MDSADQHLAPSLRAEDDVVQNVVNRMLFMNIFLITHVYEFSINNIYCQHFPHQPGNPAKERSFILALKERGFLSRDRCNVAARL